jgi:hypothetical protein
VLCPVVSCGDLFCSVLCYFILFSEVKLGWVWFVSHMFGWVLLFFGLVMLAYVVFCWVVLW